MAGSLLKKTENKGIVMLGKLIGSGYFSDVYEYGDGKIIKLMKEFCPPQYAKREYDLTKAAHSRYPWAPAVYGIEKINNRYGVVMDKASGRPVSDILIFTGGLMLKRYLKLIVDYQLKLHSILDTTLPPYEEVLENNLQKVGLSETQKEFIRKYAKTLPRLSRMCHEDFHTDNVVIKGDKVTVLDWSTAYSGNPLSDAVNMQIIMRLPIKHKKTGFPVSLVAWFFKVLIRRIYFKEYLKRTGCTMEQINAFLLPAAVIRLGEGIPVECEEALYKMIRDELKRLGFTQPAR